MYWFAIVSLSATIVCIVLGLVVYSFNKKAVLNKLFLLTIIMGFVYGFTTVMMWLSNDVDTAYFWHKMGTIWPLFAALTLNFALVFTNQKWIKNKRNYILLYAPAVAFWLTDLFTQEINGTPILKYWGYNDVASGTLIYYISTAWVASLSLIAFTLCFRHYQVATDPIRKIQAKHVTIGFGIPIIAFIATNMVPRSFGVDFPNLGVSGTLLFSIFVGYAIVKYELFTLDRFLTPEHIIAAIPDPFIVTSADNQILRVNDQIANFLGYSKKELENEPITKLLAKNEEKTWANIRLQVEKDTVIRGYELKLKTKSGDAKYVLLSGSIIYSKKNNIVGITCIMKDLTRRIELEKRLLKAERLASIGELAGQIGHDLRNPLTTIKNTIYLIKNKTATPKDKLARFCGWIDNAITDSDRIITSLVEYSCDLQLQIKNCTPKYLIHNALQTVKVPDRIKIINQTTNEVELPVDVVKMETVFAKLIQNAIDAIPSEGKIEIASTVKGANAEFSFTDSGTGIPETVLQKLFSPLVTTKAKGMGMSLAICKRIIEAHKGNISVETRKGKGTKFTIRLPLTNNAVGTYSESVLIANDNECIEITNK
jgi:PAS domain S-box-containing protein